MEGGIENKTKKKVSNEQTIRSLLIKFSLVYDFFNRWDGLKK